jgi:hypothetical protein
MPYSFHLVPRTSEAARVQINHSILTDALTPPKVSTSKTTVFSPEDVFELWCEPQAVFRVRSVGRCSATLSGRSTFYMSALFRGALSDSCRPRFTHLVLCAFPDWTVCCYWVWRRYVSSMGYGHGVAQGMRFLRSDVPEKHS